MKAILERVILLLVYILLAVSTISSCGDSYPIGWINQEVTIKIVNGEETESMDQLFTNVYLLWIVIKNVTTDESNDYWLTGNEGDKNQTLFELKPQGFELPLPDFEITSDGENPPLPVGVLSDSDGDGENDSYNPIYEYQLITFKGYTNNQELCFYNSKNSENFKLSIENKTNDKPLELVMEIPIVRNQDNKSVCLGE